MKPIHYIILFAVAGLIYLLCFAKCKRTGGGSGGAGETRDALVARLKSEFANLEQQLAPVMTKMQDLASQIKDANEKKNYPLLKQLEARLQQLIAQDKPLKDRLDAVVAQLLSLGIDMRNQ